MNCAARLTSVRAQIAAACERCDRDPATVDLVAVSKRQSVEAVRDVAAAGQRRFGENRVQELAAKAPSVADVEVAWHFVGSLQSNKVDELLAVPRLELLHSLDRIKLADRLQAVLDEIDGTLDALVQLNPSGEDAKHGLTATHARDLADHVLRQCPRLNVTGVMAMGPRAGDPAAVFASAAATHRDLQDRLGCALPTLSLGMTADLEAAVAAGSTLVRVGTGVFGPRGSSNRQRPSAE